MNPSSGERASDVRGHVEQASTDRKNTRIAMMSAGFACLMLGLAFASPPLYRIFCQVTGFGGTTQRAIEASNTVIDKSVIVRFDANVSNDLAWRFEPLQNTVEVQMGANTLAFYRATNISDKPLTGTASFNVAPDAAGIYFNKMECFCFTEQTLQPGESIEMPVSFFVDPDIVNDRSARTVTQITLSYTFFPVAPERAAAIPEKSTPGTRLEKINTPKPEQAG